MRKISTALLMCFFVVMAYAAPAILEGYRYANEKAPTGKEWESPGDLALNKEQPKAWFFSFPDLKSARKVLPEYSSYYISLNGKWKFNWVKTPEERPVDFYMPEYDVSKWDEIKVPSNWNVEGIQKNGSLKYGVPIYVNQPVIFQHRVAVDDWRGGVMRTPPTHWTTYKYRNEVGSYRRDVKIPVEWDGREVFITFDGVDSFFYLWINGTYVGFSKNSRNAATFNITSYLKKGKNTIAAEVYRNSDGSFLEAQDMFRLPGIYRSVALYSTPKVHIRDMQVFPDLDKNYKDGTLTVKMQMRNANKRAVKGHSIVYSLYEHELYSEKNKLVAGVTATTAIGTLAGETTRMAEETKIKVPNPAKWSAEQPSMYTLVAELKDNRNRTIETVSTQVGFAKVEIIDTKAEDDEFGLAGRYYYINGQTVKLKGVNRHETNPKVGHAVTREQMEEEIRLLKKANINHVRNSHYPTDPYFYYLCNKYGIYLQDEANIESHQYYYGEASLSHPIEWKPAHVARVMEMVHATINHPSIVMWSLGNEAGPGKNFVYAYDALKKVDPTRPVQYERNNAIVDVGSNQYPSIAWVNGAVKGTYNIKYPFHISEYAHSMGNACGNLIDYWNAIESTNFFMGGAIWDWVDQAVYNYDPKTGKRYMGYGGDFGDTPNDGQFVLNGIIFADLEPKPQYYEVKKVYQHIGTEAKDLIKGEVEVFNKYYFKDLSSYELQWLVYEDGNIVQEGKVQLPQIGPRKRAIVSLPYSVANLKPVSEYFVKVQYLLKNNEPWANKGYVQAEEQMLLKSAGTRPAIAEVVNATNHTKMKIAKHDDGITNVRGENFLLSFDTHKGTIYQLTYGNEQIIAPGNGPTLNALRAFVNNDNWFYTQWFERGLHNLQHRAISSNIFTRKDGAIVAAFTVVSQAPNAARIHGGTSSGRNTVEELTERPFSYDDFKFTTNQVWTVYPDGSVELQASISSNQEGLILPRLGYVMKVPGKYENFTYYGRGPVDNYPDRKSGQFIEIHQNTVAGEFVNFPKPQDMGNHEDVRWAALTNKSGKGAIFVATERMSATALQYSAMDLILASHPHRLPPSCDTYLHLDAAVTGLGGNSCGQGGPLDHDRVRAVQQSFGFIIRPANNNLSESALVAPSGEVPLSIVRNNAGEVSIHSSQLFARIMYAINNGRPAPYTTVIPLRDGGEITAWYTDNPSLKTSQRFTRIEHIPTKVIFASSEEAGSGSAHHLTDGDPNTIWHTMFSVTVAMHPHWVDLDAGEVKSINGFSYLPRSEGNNGNVKDYSLHVSIDGKEWGEPVAKGTFARNNREKRVILDKPVKGRYIRFTALSEQNGQDFASGAQLTILAE
jgi:beta-galactosidase